MTIWETTAVMEVWTEAHTSGQGKLSDSEASELFEWIKSSDIPKTFAAARKQMNGSGKGR